MSVIRQYFTYALVLALALCGILLLKQRGDVAIAKRVADSAQAAEHTAKAELAESRKAQKRDDQSSEATGEARSANDTAANKIQERIVYVQSKPIERVIPAVCPSPDADIVRESSDSSARISAAKDRLRSLRPTGDS